MYRPKGFDNPHIWVDDDGFDVYGEHYDAYEAGADAILEALWERGLRDFDKPIKGKLVFIPDE